MKVNVLSFAKFQAIFFGLLGTVAGILYSVGGFLIDLMVTLDWITTTETPGLSYGTVLAFGALIGMPALGASFGFLFGAIEAILYNLISGWLPPLKLQK